MKVLLAISKYLALESIGDVLFKFGAEDQNVHVEPFANIEFITTSLYYSSNQ
jgi:hypothetical protein